MNKHEKEMLQIEACMDYGYAAPLMLSGVDNIEIPNEIPMAELEQDEEKFWKEITLLAEVHSEFIGFQLDRAVNRIGDTGWNFISGSLGRP